MKQDTREEPRWLDEQQQEVWRDLVTWARALPEELDRDLRAATGLDLDDYEILAHLSEAEDCHLSMSVLADCLTYSRSRLTHRFDRLVDQGLVERRRCDLDGRVVYAALTEAGWELLRRVAPTHVRSVRARVIDGLEPDDLRILEDLLPRMLERLGAGDPIA